MAFAMVHVSNWRIASSVAGTSGRSTWLVSMGAHIMSLGCRARRTHTPRRVFSSVGRGTPQCHMPWSVRRWWGVQSVPPGTTEEIRGASRAQWGEAPSMEIKQAPGQRETLRTLPGDDVRQILWRFADRYDLQMLVQSARGVARGPVARLVADGGRNTHEWTEEKADLLKPSTRPASPPSSWTRPRAASSKGPRTWRWRWWPSSWPGWMPARPPAAWPATSPWRPSTSAARPSSATTT